MADQKGKSGGGDQPLWRLIWEHVKISEDDPPLWRLMKELLVGVFVESFFIVITWGTGKITSRFITDGLSHYKWVFDLTTLIILVAGSACVIAFVCVSAFNFICQMFRLLFNKDSKENGE